MATFESAVDAWIAGVIRRGEAASFDDLVCRLPGVYPTDVRSSLDRMEGHGELDATTAVQLGQRSTRQVPEHSRASPLPVPHPLDFDWRFSVSAIDRLVQDCEAGRGFGPAVLLGAPSVLWALRERHGFRALLLDVNPSVIAALSRDPTAAQRAQLCDLRHDSLPKIQASFLLADPPWYREQERLFLWAAAHLCRPGGTVLLTLAAEGTRPGIAAERVACFDWAQKLGLEVEDVEEAALAYVSPPFERNALAAAGLAGIPSEWRRSDLVVFRLREHTPVQRPQCPPDERWPEVVFGHVRIRVRPTKKENPGGVIDPRLVEIVPGDILNSVSRRDSRRDIIGVWTSGNRVFGTESPTVLLEVMLAIAAGEDAKQRVAQVLGRPLSGSETRRILAAEEKLIAVVAAEEVELVAMGWTS